MLKNNDLANHPASTRTLAGLTGLNWQTVDKRLESLKRTSRGYRLGDALPLIIAGSKDALDAREQSARKMKHQANLLEMEEQKRKGELVEAEEIKLDLQYSFTILRERLLALVDDATRLHKTIQDNGVFQMKIESRIRDMLSELAGGILDDSTNTEPDKPSM